jgi:DNA-binding NarL/FixJ family response regulator
MIDILIADADPAARKSLSLLLRRKLCMNDIHEAADVGALIGALANRPPELLFLDQKLSGSPPLETCLLLHKALPDLKIVLLGLDAEDEEIAKRAGADFICKGAAPETIISKLTSLLYKDSLEFTYS